jgi:hypothetical protein
MDAGLAVGPMVLTARANQKKQNGNSSGKAPVLGDTTMKRAKRG